MTQDLSQVLADAREEAAILRRNGHPTQAPATAKWLAASWSVPARFRPIAVIETSGLGPTERAAPTPEHER